MKNFITANERLTNNQGTRLFLFTERSRFLEADDVLKFRLLNGKQELISLID